MTTPIAPMGRAILVLTLALLPLPLFFVVLSAQAPAMLLVGAFIAAIYLGIWLIGRPREFALTAEALELRWPARRERIPLAAIAAVEVMDSAGFRARYRWAVRVGAGGLWGVFGWLRTGRGWVRAYLSRGDGLLLITLREGPPLLITPSEPEGFARAVERALEAAAEA